jgi:hypothetical protein
MPWWELRPLRPYPAWASFSRGYFSALCSFSSFLTSKALTGYPRAMGEAMCNLYSYTKGPKAIRDLANAMGISDRLFTLEELVKQSSKQDME